MGEMMREKWVIWLKALMAATAAVSLLACSSDAKTPARQEVSTEIDDSRSKQIFQVLVAEYYYNHHQPEKAAITYKKLRDLNDSAAVAKRTTEVAFQAGDFDEALDAAKRWKSEDDGGNEVNQYLLVLYQKGKQYREAADALSSLLKTYPQQSRAIEIAAAVLEQQNDEKGAYLTLQQFVEHHDNSDRASYQLALFAMRAKLYDKALEIIRNLQSLKDKDLQRKAALLRVKAFSSLDKPEQALKELNALITEAADLKTRQKYGRLMASLGKKEDAVKLLGQLHDKHPHNASVLLDMISINLDMGKSLESLPLVDKLQNLKDQDFFAHYYRGVIYEKEKQFASALAEFRKIEDKDRAILVTGRIVSVLQKMEGLDSALSHLRERRELAAQKDKDKQISLYLLESEILREATLIEEALQANQQALALSPENMDILYARALLYEDAEKIEKSEQTLQKILNVDNNNSAALNALGYMLSVHTDRFDEAYRYIKKAHDLEPEDPAIIDSLGWVSYRKGDLDDAERYLRLAYQKLQDPEVASHLIEVLTKQGHLEEAKQLLKEMLEEHPGNDKLLEAQAILMGMKSR